MLTSSLLAVGIHGVMCSSPLEMNSPLIDLPRACCSMTAVAEGVLTSRAAHDLARKKGIDCPTIEVRPSWQFAVVNA